MSDVLFGQAYFLHFDPKLWESMQPYPPLGTLYAAAVLRECGFSVALFDAMLATSEREWGDALERHRPKYAILYEDNFNYLSKMCLLRMRDAAFLMIQMAKEVQIQHAIRELWGTAKHPGSFERRHLRRAAGLVLRAVTLPIDRYALKQLSRAPHQGIGPLPRRMTQQDASRPTPQ